MGRGWKFWLFIGLLVVLHFTLHAALGIDAWLAPDLLVVAVLLGARRLSGAAAAGLGLGLGLLEDALSLSVFGAGALTNTVIGYIGSRSRDFFVGESLVFSAVYLFLGKWAHDAIYYLLARDLFREGAVDALLVRAPIAAAYAAAVGVALLLLYRTLARER